MIVRIQPAGGSFRGAGKYYLHDKLKDGEKIAVRDQGDARVWFTDTRNTLNIDPERALDEMWRTAESQAYLKAQAGVRRGGRVCEDPVKTISLSWHKDDRPEPQHMVDSADAFLKHMGWDQHQAVYVGHNDTEHRHIHIVLNRVHGETGRTLDDFRERKRAQEWALAYEKEHENLRCEQREINAAAREKRAPEIDGAEKGATQQPRPAPANDHLPHNVVMLARPLEQAFSADEQTRENQDRDQRVELKAEQRAEREAFFKDGAKLFKATRHAVYDEVRKEYAAEWRNYYKERIAAEREAEAASKSAIGRATYFAGRGEWTEAREAFADRDRVRDAVAGQFDARKAELRQRQAEDLRERQRDACDALREIREVQYRELLQRQRDERAALRAGQTIEDIRLSPEGNGREQGDGISMAPAANTNVAPEQSMAPEARLGDVERHERNDRDHTAAETLATESPEVGPHGTPAEPSERTEGVVADQPLGIVPEAPETVHQGADLAAGAIGGLANVLADLIGEMISPTPPEVRKAMVEAEHKREAERPPVDPTAAAYKRLVDKAVDAIEQERADETAWWKERDRGKDWERDR